SVPVQGLSNGARELMLLIPAGDPARFWQTGAIGGHENAFELMGNIFVYMTEHRDPRLKGDSWVVTPSPGSAGAATIKVARLEYDGNWDPEPAGWTRLAGILHNEGIAELAIDRIKLGEGKLKNGFKVAHLTGTAGPRLSEAQRAELKSF